MIGLPGEPWRRNLWVMVATTFVVFTGFAFVIPFLALYVRDLGVTDEKDAAFWAGALIGVSPLVAGFLAPVWGRLADRYPQYHDQPFDRVLVLRIAGLTGWSAAGR